MAPSQFKYTIENFRKFISGESNGIEAVRVMALPARNNTYDLAGRMLSNDYKGLVIKDGKKMLSK